MKKYVLAYDLGTSGVKGALVTPEGEVAYTATASYPLYTADGGIALLPKLCLKRVMLHPRK